MSDFSYIIGILAMIFIIPWAIVGAVAFSARDHFRKFMPYYIGGAFAVEIALFALFFGIV